MSSIIDIQHLSKRYANGHLALDDVSLQIKKGEIIALLGPNGAGKTTLISSVCGLTTLGEGSVVVNGADVVKNYRQTRAIIGLVPQELMLEPFETVIGSVRLSRGLFGKAPDPDCIEKILTQLSLWDKRNTQLRELSGGMKRRVLIAKALSHEPSILFLDEPTAGVDVELRREMWEIIATLKRSGVTIVLTTHYIEEAEEIADRIAVINSGRILLVEDKDSLMRRLGSKHIRIELEAPLSHLPDGLVGHNISLEANNMQFVYRYDAIDEQSGIAFLLRELNAAGIDVKDLQTTQSSLEEIFVELVSEEAR